MNRGFPFAIALAALLLGGCRRAEVVNHCLRENGECPPCASNADCGFSGNACTETVVCAHRDVSITVIEIGCSEQLEYSWPDPEECACTNSVCQYSDE